MNNKLEEMILEQENQLLEAQLQNRHFRKSNLEIYRQFPGYDSNMAEIYACLTALFTWKKLMKNSTVLVHTDNSAVVRAFNGPNSKQLDDFLPRQRQDVQDSTMFGEPLKEELLTRFSILLFEISNK
jgi:ribonuclease HI